MIARIRDALPILTREDVREEAATVFAPLLYAVAIIATGAIILLFLDTLIR